MVNPMTILYSVLVLLVFAAIFGTLLAVLGKKLAVKQDDRIGKVKEKLSGANCGVCGYAGCEAFAKALVEGTADINKCKATAAANKQAIAEIIGVKVDSEQTVPVVCCVGGNDAVDKYDYMGYGNCRSMELLAGGRKQCNWGCLGMGSCTDVCPEQAIEVGESGYAVISHDKCIGCGLCVETCPKGIIKRVPVDAKVYIACSNCMKSGKEVRALCKHGCIACGICAKNCPEGAITLVNNLPVIDYKKCTGCKVCVAKCPSKCIN
ncbi:MAG TPA: RnfABCDGE type electron transport complex subunit B, partial [Clostridia bacterium]|nr:RnfABCDGE type electron transport complex subunit B [Clostridia bacterium]